MGTHTDTPASSSQAVNMSKTFFEVALPGAGSCSPWQPGGTDTCSLKGFADVHKDLWMGQELEIP